MIKIISLIFVVFLLLSSAISSADNDSINNNFRLSEQEYMLTTDDLVAILEGKKNTPTYLQPSNSKTLPLLFRDAPYQSFSHREKEVGVIILNTLTLSQKASDFSLNILQVPHQYHDKLTLDIAVEMFNTGLFDVLQFNQAHRYSTEHADMSKQTLSLFNAITEAFLSSRFHGRVFQIHGFAKSKRHTEAAKGADLILSNGTVIPSKYLYQLQSCFSSNFKLLARLYGREVFELGATKNSVAKQINITQSKVEFIHIELPLEAREFILNNNLATGIARCLVDQ
ncbi:hypothetical protein [Pseudoalteromonas sp.]|uniref:hypothetical protein n=1 Tax=Pseudoalteromonas sp. TaxID=53249 RepID=UPI003562D210